ncbi:MAG: hypothetical protein QM784_02115 [Polyangiaceae bacterium]
MTTDKSETARAHSGANLSVEHPDAVCHLAGSLAQTTDWTNTWSPLFPVEKRGVLVKILRPGTALPEVKSTLAQLNPSMLNFVPCTEYILLWVASTNCDTSSSDWVSLRKLLGKHEVLHVFDYDPRELVADCLNGRLPSNRCREYMAPKLSKPFCGVKTLEQRKQLNQLMLKLFPSSAAPRICLQ